MINENRTYIVESKPLRHERQEHKRRRNTMGLKGSKHRPFHVPSPFFIIHVKDSTIQERSKAVMEGEPARQLSYKTDVRGHERVFVRRGLMPMSSEDRARYKGLDYRIYEQRQIIDDDRRRLTKRGHAQKRQNEWLAVKHVWIDEHMNSNDPDLDYVPALRVVSGEKHVAIELPTAPAKVEVKNSGS